MKRKKKLWEKQDWETALSFSYFQRYFLFQKRRPRALNEAYRLFQIEKGGKTREEAEKSSPSLSWQNWYNSKTPSRKKIPDSYTWVQRAEAYDNYLKNAKTSQDKEKRNTLLESELNDVSMQVEVWQILFETHSRIVKELSTQGELNSLGKYIRESMELSKLRESLAVFQRRSLKMPATIKDFDDDVEDEAISFEFEEPFGKDDEVGVGGEQIKEQVEQDKVEDTT